MDRTTRQAIERVIVTMRTNLNEQLIVDDLARVASYSKFHFTRVFTQATGVSPKRFLSALRLAEAQRLLLTTSASVIDISHRVGYDSVGTFSTRFSMRVGVSPQHYRRLRGDTRQSSCGLQGAAGTDIGGVVTVPHELIRGHIVVGLFASRVPEGLPVRHVVLESAAPFVLPNVPDGTWYVIARHSGGQDTTNRAVGSGRYLACHGPLEVRTGVATDMRSLMLHLTVLPSLLAIGSEPSGTRRGR